LFRFRIYNGSSSIKLCAMFNVHPILH
jgi:hypothetical protein